MKSHIVLFKLCKGNHQKQSKISDVSFSIEFRFETKIGCFVTRLCTFAHSCSSKYFLNLQIHLSIVERTTHSHIQRYFCHKHDAHERICLSIFFSQHYCNSCSLFILFNSHITVTFIILYFCLEFYFPIVDIITNHLHLTFLCSRKTNKNCCDKNVKTPL